jgi:hypothetical protein
MERPRTSLFKRLTLAELKNPVFFDTNLRAEKEPDAFLYGSILSTMTSWFA